MNDEMKWGEGREEDVEMTRKRVQRSRKLEEIFELMISAKR